MVKKGKRTGPKKGGGECELCRIDPRLIERLKKEAEKRKSREPSG